MSKTGHVPVRSCIGCRKKRKKEEMIWLVQGPAGVMRVDGKRPHTGKGFYLCPDQKCLAIARKKNKGIGFLTEIDFQHPSKKDLG